MAALKILIIGVGVLGFGLAFIIHSQLYKYVSKEKFLATSDPGALWKNSVPPREILSPEGVKLHKLGTLGIVLFIGSILVILILDTINA